MWPQLRPIGTVEGVDPLVREQEINLTFEQFRFTRVSVFHPENGLETVTYTHERPPKEKEQELFQALDAALTRIFGAPTQSDPCRSVWRRPDALVIHSSVGLRFSEPYARDESTRGSFCALPPSPSPSAPGTSWTGQLPPSLATTPELLSKYVSCLKPALARLCEKDSLRMLHVFVAVGASPSVNIYGPRFTESERSTMAACVRDAVEAARGRLPHGAGFWDARYTDCRTGWR
jgi:hypothetical protein